jgi:tRNA(Ile)-lysidine synthase
MHGSAKAGTDDPVFFSTLAKIPSNQPLAIGFSGGGDSMALLLRLLAFAKPQNRPVHALIVNHRMKPQADAESAQARKLAEQTGAKVRVLYWSGVPLSGHARARNARYQLLAQACFELETKFLLLAHTQDDQIETFLLRAGAGSGWRGLAGMGVCARYPLWPQGHGLQVLRPLLARTRQELRDELRQKNQNWIEDPANEDRRYARVMLRQNLRKWTQEGLNLNGILRTQKILQTALHEEQAQVGAGLGRYVQAFKTGYAEIDLAAEQNLTRSDLAQMLEQVMGRVSGQPRCKHRGQKLQAFWQDMMQAKTAKTLNGTLVQNTGDVLRIMRDPGAVCGRGDRLPMTVDISQTKGTFWFDNRWHIRGLDTGMVMPLGSWRGELSKLQRAALHELPASVRKTLPVWASKNAPPLVLPIDKPDVISFVECNRGMETGTCFA